MFRVERIDRGPKGGVPWVYNMAMNRRKLFQALAALMAFLPMKSQVEELHMYGALWHAPGSPFPAVVTWFSMEPSRLAEYLERHSGEYTNVVDLGPENKFNV